MENQEKNYNILLNGETVSNVKATSVYEKNGVKAFLGGCGIILLETELEYEEVK